MTTQVTPSADIRHLIFFFILSQLTLQTGFMLRNTRVKLSENVLQDDKKKKKKKEKEKKDTKDKKGALKEYVYDSSIISLAGK